jgi:toxin YhaV
LNSTVVINGWTIYAHPFFIAQLEKRIKAVEADREKDPENYLSKPNAKFLAAITAIVFERIPQDPTLPRYRQGDTLGDKYKHWFREKFFQQYRIFFRYNSISKIIIFGWVNDEKTKRAYGSKTDAYSVFADMLHDGSPPDDWTKLLAACRTKEAVATLAAMHIDAAAKAAAGESS